MLQRRDVLVLVHHEHPVLVPDRGRDLRLGGQDPHEDQQHVLEVDHVPGRLGLLVARVETGDGGGGPAGGHLPLLGGLRVALGGVQGDLGPLDLAGEVAQSGPVHGHPHALGDLGEQAHLVLDQRGHGAAHGLGPEVLQLAQGSGVEGAGLDAGHAEVAQAGAHLRGGARREGQGEGAVRVEDAGGDAVGDAVRDGAGLAGAGAGQDADGPVQGRGGPALLRVEAAEDLVGSAHAGRVLLR